MSKLIQLMQYKKLYLSLAGLLFSYFAIAQQPVQVHGTVTSSVNNDPLPGVTVMIQRTNTGTLTDGNGNYSIEATPGDTIIFSYVGFEEKQVAVDNRTVLNVRLQPSSKQLNQIVVVGYGTQKREDVIGSVSQISGEDINDRAVPQLKQALTGQLPGVTVIQRSGQPGAPGGSIQIRGVGSFGAGTAPLVLVDGMPVNSMNDINPNDVANISVLKDASSSAIYGSRAANGVILITTKKAKEHKLNVSYNAYFGIQKPTNYPKFVNSWEYATLLNEATGGGAGGYTDEEIQKFKNGTDPDHYPNINYIDEIFKDYSLQTSHNITISNKNKNSGYFMSLGYLYQNGIIEENNYNRYNLRFNLTTNIASNLTLTTRLSGIKITDRQPNTPAMVTGAGKGTLGIIGYAVRFPSIYSGRLSNGDYGTGIVGTGTPISFLASKSFYKNKTTDLNGNLRLDWRVVRGLKISLIGGYTQLNGRSDQFSSTQRLNPNVFLGPSKLLVNNVMNNYKTLQQLIKYGKTFNKHKITLLVGHSFEAFFHENSSASRLNFPSNDIVVINAGDAEGQTSGGSANESALDSYFGRIKYNYANKYLAEGTFRYDGSSRFPSDNKYAFFPSAAIGWRVSEEPFLKNRVSFLNNLKLKASYGVLGNQNIGNYPYQEIFQTGFNYGFGNMLNPGVANTRLVDSTIHWESTRTYDVGFDAGFFKGKLNIGITYYNRYTYDILVSTGASVSNILGFKVGETNSGSLENRGWEFKLDHRNNLGPVNYFLSANFSIVNNEVLDLGVANIVQPNGLVGNGSSRFIGYPLGLYYGYLTDGLYVDEVDVNKYTNQSDQSALNPSPQPGDIKYKDISGPEGIPDGKVDATYDRTILGSTIPKYSYGLNLGVSYKGFSIGALIQGVSGVEGRLKDNAGYAFFFRDGNVQRWQMEERWTPEDPNPHAEYPRLELVPNNGTPNTVLSDFWILNASYVKLRNIQVGYSLPAALLKKIGLTSLRLNISAENLFTISDYRDGWDPEINANRHNYYPIMTNYTLGINASF